jgi:hypothetical protein
MKSMFFSFLMFTALAVSAQSDKYVVAMKKNLALYDSAKTSADYQSVANTFERIGDAEKTQWLPYYYAGLALSSDGWMNANLDKDANSARINALCDKAEALEKNSEILALRNMSATQQMLVDPQTRWATYGVQAGKYLDDAIKMNPDNPRLYYLRGESVLGTPPAFGGGKDKAKPLFEKALALYKTDNPKPLWPNWGKDRAEEELAKCQ